MASRSRADHLDTLLAAQSDRFLDYLNAVAVNARLQSLGHFINILLLKTPELLEPYMPEYKGVKDAPNLEQLAKFESFINEMELVFSVSTFDTFLTEALKLCCAARPNFFLKGRSIALSVILSGKLIDEVNETIASHVREKAFSSFADRLKYLQTQLTIDFKLTADQWTGLRKWSGLRNKLMHDRGVHDISIGPDLAVEIEQKIHANDGQLEDRDQAMGLFNNIAAKVYLALLPVLCDSEREVELHKTVTARMIHLMLNGGELTRDGQEQIALPLPPPTVSQ